MVRLKLAARRPVLPTGADSPDYDFAMTEPGPSEPGPSGGQSMYDMLVDEEHARALQVEDDAAIAADMQAEEDQEATTAPPAQARASSAMNARVRNVFEDAIMEVEAPAAAPPPPPPPPHRLPAIATVPAPMGSARRLVCRDRTKQKNQNTWDSFHGYGLALTHAKKARLKRRPAGTWPKREVKNMWGPVAKANKDLERWADGFRSDTRRDPSVSEWEKAAQRLVNKYMPDMYVAPTLPPYKCMARAPTAAENQKLAANRKEIGRIREMEKGDHQLLGTSIKREGELDSLAEVIGPPVFLHASARSQGVASLTYTDTDTLHNEYQDFIDEERRDILSTIRRANARLGRENVRIADLEEQERLDALAEYAPLFENETRDDLFLAQSNVVVVEVDDPGSGGSGKTMQRAECYGTPETNFDNPDATDPQAKTTEGGEAEVEKREEAAKKIVDEHLALLDEKQNVSKKGPKDQPKPQFGRGTKIYKEVRDLIEENDCEPCKEWEFPEKVEPGNGYYQAIRRVLEVNNQMGNQGTKGSQQGGGTTLDWPYYAALMQDPLMHVASGTGKPNDGRVTLLDTLELKYTNKDKDEGKVNRKHKTALQTELLRCFPEKMPKDTSRLNPIVDFVCWWHKNITKKAVGVDRAGEKNKTKTEAAKNSLVYRALCCPDAHRTSQYPGEEESFMKLRRSLHGRVRVLIGYMELIKKMLDADVFHVAQAESVLWTYMEGQDPVATQLARGVYERWKELNPMH